MYKILKRDSGPFKRMGDRGGRRRPSQRSDQSSGGSAYGERSGGPRRSGGGRPAGGSSRGGSSRGSFGGGSFNRSPRRGGGKTQQIDVSRFINKAAVVTEEVEAFVPEHKFTDFPIDELLKITIARKGYLLPTPIQDRAIPHILQGQDLVGIANTGTGKTGAFLIPLIQKALKQRDARILIMVPTRELAQQIDEEFRALASGMRLFAACCVGGAAIGAQLGALRRRPAFVIGTPGRLKDLLERRAFDLAEFSTVVLDEADRMLDMGFINDMRVILAKLAKDRHTLFFSATLSPEIEKLIGEFLNQPVRISVKTGDTSKDVDQDIIRLTAGQSKLDVLTKMLRDPELSKVLVFGRTKHGVEKLAQLLGSAGIKAESIHGNKTQGQRQRSLAAFKQDKAQVLVATDVAARGLDISGISHVINYDLPSTYEDYVHRIGRTGRAGKKGKALTFVE
jgi:superfamily II DNA/RNA helicase